MEWDILLHNDKKDEVIVIKQELIKLNVLILGKAFKEKSRLLSGIAQINETPPPPNSGNLVVFFPDVKTTYYAYDRKKYQWC